ncbi:MAG: phosphoribosyltransferase family protein [Chloroflexi bacterium]|nr:phosphoribosyltransferase family protein [Chloroflexota bacterium]
MHASSSDPGNLWLARILWDSGAVEFGKFNVGSTTDSPIWVNVRRIVSNPRALRAVGQLIREHTRTLSGMLRPAMAPFELVAGVPIGGLHIATAYALVADLPLIYPHPRAGTERYEEIEGSYFPGQTALIVDDLITGGTSMLATAETLRSAGLMVHDAVALLDRQAGGQQRLKAVGIQLHALLTLEMLLNYLESSNRITEAQYARCMAYIQRTNEY